MQQVLEHHALATGLLVLAKPCGDLVHRADERALGVAREPGVEVGVAVDAAVEPPGALERVVVGRADQAAGHRRVAERAVGTLAGALDLGADRARSRRGRRTACCTRRRSGRPARPCRACRCRRRGSADAAAAAASAARARPPGCSRRRGSRRVLLSRGGARSRAARRSARAARSSRGRESVGAVLALHPAGAEAELDPAAGDVVDGRGGVREQARQAERRGRDERPEAQRRRARGEARERRPGVVRDVPGLVRLRDVVVGAEERVDPVLLAGVGEVAPLLPGDAFLALDHQGDAHRAILRGAILRGRHVKGLARAWPRLVERGGDTAVRDTCAKLAAGDTTRGGLARAWPRLEERMKTRPFWITCARLAPATRRKGAWPGSGPACGKAALTGPATIEAWPRRPRRRTSKT